MAIITGFLTVGTTLTGTDDFDQIYGNARGTVNVATGSDRIFGRGGDDFILGDTGAFDNSSGDFVAGDIGPAGRGGNDTIEGGDGFDVIYGDTSNALFGIGGNDILYQNADRGLLVGDADFVSTSGRCGNDRLYGDGDLIGDAQAGGRAAGYGNDLLVAGSASGFGSELYGDLRNDALEGNSLGGRDTLRGGAFEDVIVGDAWSLGDDAAGGNDRLWGNGGADQLFGDVEDGMFETSRGGNDVLRGGAGDDILFGDSGDQLSEFTRGGNDRLEGGVGDDELWGDGELEESGQGGKDKFVFSGNFGDDLILDFRQEDGDVIVLQGLTQSEVQISRVAFNDPNDSTLITTVGDDSITLVGFTGSLVTGTDIIFA
jgi:Ca2+-binding RTX toxin-like protein